MQSTERRVLVVDVGNTRTKGAITKDGKEFLLVFNVSTSNFNLKLLFSFSNYPIAVSSVVPEISKIIQTGIPKVFFVSQNLKLPITIDYKSQLGADRIANLVGGLSYSNSFIVGSFGTATVIDVVINRKFVGGYIFPGIKTMAKALSKFTKKLPEVEVTPSITPGNSTEECISSGISVSTVGAFKFIRDKFKLPTVITGGYGEHIKKLLDVIHDRNLTFKGIYRIFEINGGYSPR